MRPQTLVFAVLATLVTISTGFPHDLYSQSPRHARLAHRAPSNDAQTGKVSKRCKQRPKVFPPGTSAGVHSSASPPAQTPQPKSSGSQNTGGVIHVSSSFCGSSGAIAKTSATSGPNGNIDWLNCGLSSGGWNPPYVAVQDVVAKDLRSAVASPNSVFAGCAPFISSFEAYGSQYGIPPIMLASFAMQESSCNPHAVGGAGEQGLMQLSRDKCGDAPGGDCQNADYNIHTGAKFFSSTLNNNNGNLLLSIGLYNGWHKGLTYAEATSAAKTSCCRCQNNLDYLHQFLNGWLQNIDAHSLGKYFNLDVCH